MKSKEQLDSEGIGDEELETIVAYSIARYRQKDKMSGSVRIHVEEEDRVHARDYIRQFRFDKE